jgi:hypothetical protein
MLKAASDFDRMAHDAEQREIEQGLSHLRALANGQNTAPRILVLLLNQIDAALNRGRLTANNYENNAA